MIERREAQGVCCCYFFCNRGVRGVSIIRGCRRWVCLRQCPSWLRATSKITNSQTRIYSISEFVKGSIALTYFKAPHWAKADPGPI